MQTLAFHIEAKKDIDLLMLLAQRIGIQRVENSDFDFLNFLNDENFRLEIAVFMFKSEKFTLGKASEFARLHQLEFQKILAERKIPIHYDSDELKQDLDALKHL